MTKKYLFNESDLQFYREKVNIEIKPEDELALQSKKIKTEEDIEVLLRKYGKKFFLIFYNKDWDIRSYKNIEDVNSYFLKTKPGFSKKGQELINNCLLNYNPKKEDILKLKEIDIEFLLTEGIWEERAQLLFHLDYYKKQNKPKIK